MRCFVLFSCLAVAAVLGTIETQVARGQSVAFVSQVNTDAFGHNILGDAANESSIAVDPNDPNKMVIGWRQFDTIESSFRRAGVAYTSDGGRTWTAGYLNPNPNQSGSDPVVRCDADGNFYYASIDVAWLDAFIYKSADGGVSWSSPVFAYGGDKEWIAIDRTSGPGRGNIYETCTGPFAVSTDGGASFAFKGNSPMKWGTMDVGENGTLYAAGGESYNIVFAKSTNAQYAGQTPTFTYTPLDLGGGISYGPYVNPDGLLGQTWLATDHSQTANRGNIYVLASVRPSFHFDPGDVMFIRSTDDGATWSKPIRINNDPTDDLACQWFGTMSVAPNGRIDAIWNDTRNDPTAYFAHTSQLYYAYSLDAGDTWLGNIPLSEPFDSHLGWPRQLKIGDYYDMVSDDLGVNLAFAATFTGGQDVYFMRILAVPEPSSIVTLFGAACCGLAYMGMARRRKRL